MGRLLAGPRPEQAAVNRDGRARRPEPVERRSRPKRSRYALNSLPIRSRKASRYLSLVLRTTSGGRMGPGGRLVKWIESRLSRTNCLSNEGGEMPARYSLGSREPGEAGGRTSAT